MKKQSIKSDAAVLDRLYSVIQERTAHLSPDSYVASLIMKGKAQLHAKIAEEAGELIEASRQASRDGIIGETADLIFHLWVLLGQWGIGPDEIYGELERRRGMSGIQEKESRKAKAD
jgi:phosphoribosyl-ATP pyrophosphohydrolase